MKPGGNHTLSDIAGVLSGAQRIMIAGHVNPDGDAVGSCLALAICLKSLGKEVCVALEEYHKKYDILGDRRLVSYVGGGVEHEADMDLYVALDCGASKRLGLMEKPFLQSGKLLMLDHHTGNDYFGNWNYVDSCMSSTSEIVYGVIGLLGHMNREIAAALYGGIVFDTGGFRHGNTTPSTLRVAAELVSTGIDFSHIYNGLMYCKSLPEAMVFSGAVQRMKVLAGGRVAYTAVTRMDMDLAGASSKDLDGVVEYMLNIEGVEIAVFAYEKDENETKISLRSKQADCNRIAGLFGGGGHRNAAGCSISTNISEALAMVLEKVKGCF